MHTQNAFNVVNALWDRGITKLYRVSDDFGAHCGLVDDPIYKIYE